MNRIYTSKLEKKSPFFFNRFIYNRSSNEKEKIATSNVEHQPNKKSDSQKKIVELEEEEIEIQWIGEFDEEEEVETQTQINEMQDSPEKIVEEEKEVDVEFEKNAMESMKQKELEGKNSEKKSTLVQEIMQLENIIRIKKHQLSETEREEERENKRREIQNQSGLSFQQLKNLFIN